VKRVFYGWVLVDLVDSAKSLGGELLMSQQARFRNPLCYVLRILNRFVWMKPAAGLKSLLKHEAPYKDDPCFT